MVLCNYMGIHGKALKEGSKIFHGHTLHLVHLNMPLLGLLKSLEPLVVRNSLLLTDSLEHVLDSRHHSLKSAEVDVGTGVKLVEDLVGVLLDLILNVHLSSLLVLLLTAEGVVETEVVGVTGLRVLELVVVKEGVRVGNSEEEPGLILTSQVEIRVKEAKKNVRFGCQVRT